MRNKNRHCLIISTFLLLCVFSFNVFAKTDTGINPQTSSQTNHGFSIEPIITQSYGSVWYRLEASEPITTQEDAPLTNIDFTDTIVQSELEYPLDVLIGGVKIKKLFKQKSRHPLSIELYFWKNIDNPNDKMKDSDWFGARNQTTTNLYKFSYTESRSTLDWAGIELNLESYKHKLFQNVVSYGLKVSGDYSYHRLYGADGWRKYPDTLRQTLFIPQEVQVLTYKLWRIEPSAYIKINIINNAIFSWQTSFAFSPFAVAKDLDDHVLRNKTTETTALGTGLGFTNFAAIKLSQNLSLIATFDIRFFRTKGKMTQEYYGDDPGSIDRDETGLVLGGINNIISSFTQQASVSFRYLY